MRTREFEDYLIQGEPGQAEKREAWKTAIRLQALAGQNPPVYLADIAKDHAVHGGCLKNIGEDAFGKNLWICSLCHAHTLFVSQQAIAQGGQQHSV